jgi:hypothetical protein
MDLAWRFEYHPPTTEAEREAHQEVRNQLLELAQDLEALLPDGREKALTITKLEEAMFWANAAIARAKEEDPNG